MEIIRLILLILGFRHFFKLDGVDSFHNASGTGYIAPMNTTSEKLFSSFYAIFVGVAVYLIDRSIK